MINFIRTIRQGLFWKQKFGQYLLYALGETVLVMIGILLALQVDNWNEENKKQKQVREYLRELNDEFLVNIKNLKSMTAQNQRNMEAAREIIESKRAGTLKDSNFAILLKKMLAKEASFPPSTSVLEEMINAGSLKDFKNQAIKRKVLAWKTHIIAIKEQEEEVRFYADHLEEVVLQDGDYRKNFEYDGNTIRLGLKPIKTFKGNQTIIDSTPFENYTLLFLTSSYTLHTNDYLPTETFLQELVEAINEVLK